MNNIISGRQAIIIICIIFAIILLVCYGCFKVVEGGGGGGGDDKEKEDDKKEDEDEKEKEKEETPVSDTDKVQVIYHPTSADYQETDITKDDTLEDLLNKAVDSYKSTPGVVNGEDHLFDKKQFVMKDLSNPSTFKPRRFKNKIKNIFRKFRKNRFNPSATHTVSDETDTFVQAYTNNWDDHDCGHITSSDQLVVNYLDQNAAAKFVVVRRVMIIVRIEYTIIEPKSTIQDTASDFTVVCSDLGIVKTKEAINDIIQNLSGGMTASDFVWADGMTVNIAADRVKEGYPVVELNTTYQKETPNTPPIIILNGDPSITVKIGEDFDDPGAECLDEEDGPFDPIVDGDVDTNKAGQYTITYTCRDSGGEVVTKTRTVYVEGPSGSPEIKVPNTMTIFTDEKYPIPPATATDSDGNPITDLKKEVGGGFNPDGPNPPGKYVVKWTATDSGGQVVTGEQVIIVKDRMINVKIDKDGDGVIDTTISVPQSDFPRTKNIGDLTDDILNKIPDVPIDSIPEMKDKTGNPAPVGDPIDKLEYTLTLVPPKVKEECETVTVRVLRDGTPLGPMTINVTEMDTTDQIMDYALDTIDKLKPNSYDPSNITFTKDGADADSDLPITCGATYVLSLGAPIEKKKDVPEEPEEPDKPLPTEPDEPDEPEECDDTATVEIRDQNGTVLDTYDVNTRRINHPDEIFEAVIDDVDAQFAGRDFDTDYGKLYELDGTVLTTTHESIDKCGSYVLVLTFDDLEDEPEKPIPGDDDEPDKPIPGDDDEPDKPVEPDKPIPGDDDEPDKPLPDKPVEPDKPLPDKPVEPDKPLPDKPVEPDKPLPDKPVEPDKPLPDKPPPTDDAKLPVLDSMQVTVIDENGDHIEYYDYNLSDFAGETISDLHDQIEDDLARDGIDVNRYDYTILYDSNQTEPSAGDPVTKFKYSYNLILDSKAKEAPTSRTVVVQGVDQNGTPISGLQFHIPVTDDDIISDLIDDTIDDIDGTGFNMNQYTYQFYDSSMQNIPNNNDSIDDEKYTIMLIDKKKVSTDSGSKLVNVTVIVDGNRAGSYDVVVNNNTTIDQMEQNVLSRRPENLNQYTKTTFDQDNNPVDYDDLVTDAKYFIKLDSKSSANPKIPDDMISKPVGIIRYHIQGFELLDDGEPATYKSDLVRIMNTDTGTDVRDKIRKLFSDVYHAQTHPNDKWGEDSYGYRIGHIGRFVPDRENFVASVATLIRNERATLAPGETIDYDLYGIATIKSYMPLHNAVANKSIGNTTLNASLYGPKPRDVNSYSHLPDLYDARKGLNSYNTQQLMEVFVEGWPAELIGGILNGNYQFATLNPDGRTFNPTSNYPVTDAFNRRNHTTGKLAILYVISK